MPPSGAQRRQQLLDATCAVIARRGLRGLRADEVAADAGVSTALVYYHFGDREGLLSAAFDHAYTVVSDLADAGTEAMPPTKQLLERALGEFQYDDRARELAAVWFEVWANVRFEAALAPHVRALIDRWVTGFAATIREGQATGELSPSIDPEASAARIIAMIEGLRPRWLDDALSTDEARRLLTEGIRRELLLPPALLAE